MTDCWGLEAERPRARRASGGRSCKGTPCASIRAISAVEGQSLKRGWRQAANPLVERVFGLVEAEGEGFEPPAEPAPRSETGAFPHNHGVFAGKWAGKGRRAQPWGSALGGQVH